MELLKFLTCGSVDDGKSTLIGHMLYAAKLIFADQLQALELDSKVGSADGNIDYSLLLDGLEAEREQGITIDVAYRFFSTQKRRFIVADTPGHVEYTRNMAVGASFANLAVILVDVTKGVLVQTKRHCRICALMGIRDFVFAVNKMDLCGYSEQLFEETQRQIELLVKEVSNEMEAVFNSVSVIPVSATNGDNIIECSPAMPWYSGDALLSYLESVIVQNNNSDNVFSMPVQRVCRPNAFFRGYQGEIRNGNVSIGDSVVILPSGENALVNRILSSGSDVEEAGSGESVTLCLDRDVDVSRGCIIASEDNGLHVGTTFVCEILWMNDTELKEFQRFKLQLGTGKSSCSIADIQYCIDINSGERINAKLLKKNELAVCVIHADTPIVFDRFSHNKTLGEFILIDSITNFTAACGIVLRPMGIEGQPHKQALSITRKMRENRNGYLSKTVWFTGLSGSGKSTIADLLERTLFELGINTSILDGDNVRMGLCKGLGFAPTDRTENIRRVAETAKLMNEAGIVVLCSFISPFEADRQMAKKIIGEDNFIEVFVDAGIETCMKRDTKGLYKKALLGEIREFTGISSPYETPESPDIIVHTDTDSVEDCKDIVLEVLWKELHKSF